MKNSGRQFERRNAVINVLRRKRKEEDVLVLIGIILY